MFELVTLSALEKLIPGTSPAMPERENTVLSGEVATFEIAYRSDERLTDIECEVVSDIASAVTLRKILAVPATTVSMGADDTDDFYTSKVPFLCPDVLKPFGGAKLNAMPGLWQTLFVTVRGKVPAGKHEITFRFTAEGKPIGEVSYTLHVLRTRLGKNGIHYTNWFHYDGIANYYRQNPFTPAYMRIVDAFVRDAAEHGMNTLLVPMFTPPLDTRIGGERLTVQLVDVWREGRGYRFSFDRLVAFMKRVGRLGIENYEMSHLFTQWGAEAAPKIVVHTEAGDERIFGWDTPATGDAYRAFLSAFLPALRERLVAEGLYEKCIFHISDEPNAECAGTYAAARQIAVSLLPDAPFMDALSEYEFYEKGLVTRPVSLTAAITPFLEHEVPDLWAYDCCGPCGDNYSGRHMAMSLLHLRILGFSLYLAGVKGFLHWGYNFYNCVTSDEPVDPFLVTDANGAFPSGDPFIVYPGADGKPLDSLRHETIRSAFADLAMMKRVEEKIGRAAAVKLLTDEGFSATFRIPEGGYAAHATARAKAQRILEK